ncbi:hypothetical protein SAMN05428976_11011 [Clostridium sp. USBA 49]|uniref:glycosyltransferase family 2 protein n=1 Tax=Clostridium sp. USBA 49 TaxID=1881060 RepID=UPI00099A8AC6|nr:glycosyltransferase family 2 protein [Clostridium sp. USBA 49]SKA87522.1 hypothetical protein SAMN05428976_11011 [Clostridium sp. USBA 49]
MENQPLVYIILINYNGWKDTIQCIDSIRNIDYNNYKIVIVDNNSKDNSVENIKKIYPNITILEENVNLGFAGGNNEGIRYALQNNADYVLLLNNDTEVKKDFLSVLIERIKKEPKIGIATGKINYYDNKRIIWYAGGVFDKLKGNSYHIGVDEKDNNQYDEEKEISFISGCFMLIPSKVFNDIGLLSEDYFLYHEDTDFCCKIMSKGYKLFYYPKSIIYHKVSASTGRKSKLYDYYYTRNRCILISKNLVGGYKYIAYTFFFVTRIVKFLSPSTRRTVIIKGINDFIKKRWGYQRIE